MLVLDVLVGAIDDLARCPQMEMLTVTRRDGLMEDVKKKRARMKRSRQEQEMLRKPHAVAMWTSVRACV